LFGRSLSVVFSSLEVVTASVVFDVVVAGVFSILLPEFAGLHAETIALKTSDITRNNEYT
jgi:hypothetical protein